MRYVKMIFSNFRIISKIKVNITLGDSTEKILILI